MCALLRYFHEIFTTSDISQNSVKSTHYLILKSVFTKYFSCESKYPFFTLHCEVLHNFIRQIILEQQFFLVKLN